MSMFDRFFGFTEPESKNKDKPGREDKKSPEPNPKEPEPNRPGHPADTDPWVP